MENSRRFSWPLDNYSDVSNNGMKDVNNSLNGKYVDIDNINLLVKLQTFVDDFILNDIQFNCNQNCDHNHRLKSSQRTPSQSTPSQSTPSQSTPSHNHSFNGVIHRNHHNLDNNIVININEETIGFSDFKVPNIKNSISRTDSSSITTTSSSETTTSCSSCMARESISSKGSSSSSYSHHVIVNENIMSSSISSNSDSEAISNISGFSGGLNSLNNSPLDTVLLPDEFILHELSEMRALLEQILENRQHFDHQWNHANTDEFLNMLGFSLSDVKHLELRESSADFPIGGWEYHECGVCLEVGWLYKRYCCNYCACISCLRQYYWSRIEFGTVTIECINPLCRSYVHRHEISARLSPEMKEVYHRLLLTSTQSDRTKPCPQCNYFLTLTDDKLKQMKSKYKDPTFFRVQCTECQFFWCFKCHSPWHSELSCKQYRKGDRLLKTWAKETNHGQVNAQRCPRCSIYIQRTSGCDHMHCTRCKTDFCYKCGDKLRRLKFFGDHYSKLSIFGCKYRYKADKPLQRKLIRGAVFGSKVMLVPILGSLALMAGSVVVVLGVAALPLYGAVKIYRKYRDRKNLKNIRQQMVSTISSSITNID